MLTFALALAVQATPVPVPAGDNASDARCIVVLGSLGARGGPEQAQAARQGIMYFTGKLRGRNPSVDVGRTILRAANEAQAAGMNARAEAARCGAEIGAVAAATRSAQPSPAPRPNPRRP